MLGFLKKWMMKWMGLPSCEEIEGFAYSYLEGDLKSDLKVAFERHIRGCRNCKNFVDSYRRVADPGPLLGKIPLDRDFERRVIEFLKQSR